jgi:hypothetical protein
MKLIIAGSRTIYPGGDLFDLLNYFNIRESEVTELIHGNCPSGVDKWVDDFYLCSHFEADWNKHGKAAGPIRNREMAKYGDVLLLIWDGESRGSANMKSEMLKLNKPVYEVILKIHNL